jgi:hypothetical protein
MPFCLSCERGDPVTIWHWLWYGFGLLCVVVGFVVLALMVLGKLRNSSGE